MREMSLLEKNVKISRLFNIYIRGNYKYIKFKVFCVINIGNNKYVLYFNL